MVLQREADAECDEAGTTRPHNAVCGVGQNRMYALYMTVFGGFPAKSTVHTPYTYGSGQP